MTEEWKNGQRDRRAYTRRDGVLHVIQYDMIKGVMCRAVYLSSKSLVAWHGKVRRECDDQ